jgi:signal transduction histidine kinase
MQKKSTNFIQYFLNLSFCLLLSVNANAQSKADEVGACGANFEKKYTDALAISADAAISYCLQSLGTVNEKCKVEVYRVLAECYGTKMLSDKVLFYLKKGLEQAAKTHYNKESMLLNLQVFDYYLSLSEKEKALPYLDSATFFLNKYSSINEDASYLSRKASLFNYLENSDSNLHYINLSLKLYEKQKDTLDMGITLHNLGNLYVKKAEYKTAVQYLLKALYYQELINDKTSMAGALIQLANCYKSLNQHATARNYILKAKDICIEIGNQDYLYYVYFLLAQNSSSYFNDHSKLGLIYADSAILLAETAKNKLRIADAKSVKADLMFSENINVNEAEKEALESIHYFEKVAAKFELCFSSFGLGRFYFRQKRFTEAKLYLNNTIQLSAQAGISKLLIETNSMLSSIYEHDGDFKKALYHHQQFYKYKDSLESGLLKSDMAELEKKYAIGKKETEIVNLNKEKQLKNADLKQAKTRQNFFLITSLLLVTFVFAGIWAYRKLQANKNQLSKTNAELDNLNQVKNRLFSIIAHDVKGLAIPFQRASRILNHHIKKQNFEKTLEVAKQLETNAESLSNLLDNLLQWSMEQMNGYTPRPELLSLKNEITQIIESYEGHANFKNTELLQDIPENLSIETDKGAFHVIFRNLLANAIKYTENGSIKIGAAQENNSIVCHVKDTGTGINAGMVDKLFNIESDKIKNGTAGEKGSGLGLVLVKKFLELNGGSIKVNSAEGTGTDFIISFPLKNAA